VSDRFEGRGGWGGEVQRSCPVCFALWVWGLVPTGRLARPAPRLPWVGVVSVAGAVRRSSSCLPSSRWYGRSFSGLEGVDIGTYYHHRILRWDGHVSRMSVALAPRQLLTGWVAQHRPNGCTGMTSGRKLKTALKCKWLPVNCKEWRAIAEVRPE